MATGFDFLFFAANRSPAYSSGISNVIHMKDVTNPKARNKEALRVSLTQKEMRVQYLKTHP